MESEEEDSLLHHQELMIISCCTCGVTFAIPRAYEAHRRDDHVQFHCPNGHPQAFLGKSNSDLAAEVERLLKENAELKNSNLQLRAQLDQAEARFYQASNAAPP